MIIAFQRNDHWMLFASALRLVFPPSLDSQVVVDSLGAPVVFRDLDESVLLVGLQKAELSE